MGLFSGLRNGVKSVSGMVSEVKTMVETAAADQAGAAAANLQILNSTPQDGSTASSRREGSLGVFCSLMEPFAARTRRKRSQHGRRIPRAKPPRKR